MATTSHGMMPRQATRGDLRRHLSACGQHIEYVTDGACTVLVACLVGIREASALPTWAPDTPTRFATQPASFPRRPESSGSRLVRARVRTGTIIRASWGAESVNFSGSWHRIVPHGAPPTRGTSGSGSAACAGGRGAAWAWPTGMKKGPHRRSDAALRMWFVLFARHARRLLSSLSCGPPKMSRREPVHHDPVCLLGHDGSPGAVLEDPAQAARRPV